MTNQAVDIWEVANVLILSSATEPGIYVISNVTDLKLSMDLGISLESDPHNMHTRSQALFKCTL